MERIIKTLLIILTAICFITPAKAAELNSQQLITPTNVAFENCTKTYNISAEKLYYLTLNSITANRFETKELQSKMGYILFKAAGKEFLATVAYYGPNKSILKITPVNNSYYFAPGIVLNIFQYIDVYMDEPLEEIKNI